MSAAHHIPNPFDAYFEQLAEAVAGKVLDAMPKAPALPDVDLGIEPSMIYKQGEVADFLRTSASAVSRIPVNQLPKVRRAGSAIGYYGINIICYIHGLPPVDTEAITREYRERLMDVRPKVHPITQGKGKTRIK